MRAIFAHPTSLLHHPESLDLLVKRIDELDWYNARKKGFGDLYEDLLQRHAYETRGGAGQYFTPRPLIECMVNVTRPETGEIIQDPAAGTCGFLVAVDAYIKNKKGKHPNQRRSTSPKVFYHAVELNPDTYRLALMNTMLHNIKGEIKHDDTLSPAGLDIPKAHVILTNPPFGSKKGSGRSSRSDLPFPTSNKQFAFLQHIYLGLKPGGRAGVVVPDNVLFEENIKHELGLAWILYADDNDDKLVSSEAGGQWRNQFGEPWVGVTWAPGWTQGEHLPENDQVKEMFFFLCILVAKVETVILS